MLRKWLIKMSSPEDTSSLSAKLRKKRFALFKKLLPLTSYPLKILDVGGRETIWAREGFCDPNITNKFQITILNIRQETTTFSNVKYIVGDARNMSQFADNEFDIVFSNSVIEHVGNFDYQLQMAQEIQRVGKKYFVQTPNFYFPIEPHFVFPFFQFLPLSMKVWVLTNIGRKHKKVATPEQAKIVAKGINLLRKKQFSRLFPKATIFEEKVLGLTKSFVAYE